jgi:hypothetical protein
LNVNEGAKTGIFWGTALVVLAVAIFVSWPPRVDSDTQALIGQPLFPAFTDPLAASSLRIVTFDDSLGELRRFEVAKDETTGVWSLPSRNNYPADAAEQMQRAANALVGVKVLDVQTENAEDHASLGVVEPKPEALEVGDEGVGRLVAFKGDKNVTLANVIIGNRVGDSGEKRYVRIPQQDPVYVVNLDDTIFSTKFEDWIEKDLLQLSSIDINTLQIESYDAALEGGNSLALNRSYDAALAVDGSNNWELLSLTRYDEQQQPREVSLKEGEKLATSKLNDIKNALDDLKIVDVAAKPKGMSENLKADKELVSDNEAVRSLAVRGFFPFSSGDILSANGETKVTLNDGVQYVLRFGNVQGLSADGGEDENAGAGGANRYLLVTAQVDDSKFPPPELRSIPKSVEELDAMTQADSASPEAESPADNQPDNRVTEPEPGVQPNNEVDMPQVEPAGGEPAQTSIPDAPGGSLDDAAAAPTDEDDAATACEPQDQIEPADNEIAADEAGEQATEPNDDATAPRSSDVEQTEAVRETVAAPTDAAAAEQPLDSAVATPTEDAAAVIETAEEKQERLEAEQEKITKENQRKLDERKDRVDAARRRVRELNGRFAEWYYVIPETTYRKLKLSLDDLIEKPAATEEPAAPESDASEAPTFDIPN